MVCAVCSAARLSTPAPPEPLPHLYASANQLRYILDRDPALAWELARFLSTGASPKNADMINNLWGFMIGKPSDFQLLKEQSWFTDGLNDEEADFLVVMKDITENSQSDYEEMVKERFTQSSTANLPLAGEVHISVIQKTPFPKDENLVAQIEEAITLIEEVTGLPFPVRNVIVLIPVIEPGADYEYHHSNLAVAWTRGAHAGSFIRVPRYESGTISKSTLYHELGHYYFNFFPAWLTEGGAQFATAYIRDWNGAESMEAREAQLRGIVESNCKSEGIENLHELERPGIGYRVSPVQSCFYVMGEHFLVSMFLELGHQPVTSALRDLRLLILSEERVLWTVPPKDIYRAFLNNTPPSLQDEFRRLFEDLHGGPLAEDRANVPDDHVDDPSAATGIQVDEAIAGVMDHSWDIDTFSFVAEEGHEYRIIFNHQNMEDFTFTLHASDGGPPQTIQYRGEGQAGLEARWNSARSGQYLIAVESLYGTTGDYKIEVSHVVAGEDDYGDESSGAFPMAAGEAVKGTIDSGADVDYFRFNADAGNGYRVEVENQTLAYSRIAMYGPNGKTPVDDQFTSYGHGLKGAELEWTAGISGDYYLAVYSPEGGMGSYTLTVSTVVTSDDDHGDDAPSATAITLGEPVDGAMDHPFDYDYFEILAEPGRAYNIRFDYLTMTHQPVTLFAADGVTPVHTFEPFGYDHGDSHLPWVAPSAGPYYLALSSPDGDVGTYRMAVYTADDDPDDHGDSVLTSTEVAVGSVITGAVDHQNDYDFFRFEAEEGRRYDIEADFSTSKLPADSRLSLYSTDGVTHETRFLRSGRTYSTKYFHWVAPNSGEYYIVTWSAGEGAADYSLSVVNVAGQSGQ